MHVHSHIFWAAASGWAMDSCVAVVTAHQNGITFGLLNGQSRVSVTLYWRGECKKHSLSFASEACL